MLANSNGTGSIVMLIGIGLSAILLYGLPGEDVVALFSRAAYIVGASLLVATLLEGRRSVRNLLRVDLLLLWALYGLTFFEFLFPQPTLGGAVSVEAAQIGTMSVLIGFAGIVIGRHFVSVQRPNGSVEPDNRLPPGIFPLFVGISVLGYLYILLAVNFDIIRMLVEMSQPRFTQSWGRGRFGDINALFYELGMLIYLIPPLAGLVFARANEFSVAQKTFVALMLILTLYYAIGQGTRNVIVTYVIGFVGTYFMTLPKINPKKLLALGATTVVFLFVTTTYMLEFRNVGLKNFSFEQRQYETVFVDQNLVNISRLTQVFPSSIDYLGLEIPFHALIRPIPRALWSGKPEGLTTSIEAALGVGNAMTLSCTFVGEAYMAGGFLAVGIFGLLFGWGAAMWNRLGARKDSSVAQLLYISGFVCAAVAMRSVLSMVPLMLPSLALWLAVRGWLSRKAVLSRARVH